MNSLKKAYKKAPTYILNDNITLEDFRKFYNRDYSPAWEADPKDIGYALTDNLSFSQKIWWVGKDFFDKNYEIVK